MTAIQVVETSVTVNNNSPIQDYVHLDDQTQPTFEMTPRFKPFTVIFFVLCQFTWLILQSSRFTYNRRLIKKMKIMCKLGS